MSCVHSTHCCILHGCKYGDEDCPVATGIVKQEYTCESCGEYYGISTLDELDQYILLEKTSQELKIEALNMGAERLKEYLSLEENCNDEKCNKMLNYINLIINSISNERAFYL